MKKTLKTTSVWAVLLAALILGFKQPASEDSIKGAWSLQKGGFEEVLLFQDGYFTHTVYNLSDKKFIFSRGGTYQHADSQLKIMMEFHSKDKEEVGKTLSYSADAGSKQLQADINGKSEKWNRIDNGSAPLAGVWRITGRMQDGKITAIHQTGPRKTLKILTGKRFQWAAINPETKEFSGTGGGTYTFKNGKYTEKIEFFSRDGSRTGASLTFDGKLENGKWHHSGLSSKGAPIYEIWERTLSNK